MIIERLKKAAADLKRIWVPITILVLAFLIVVVLWISRPGSKPIEVTEKAWLVSIETVRRQTASPMVTLYGRVESLWSSILSAGVNAEVLEAAVIAGDNAARGDLLVRLDDRDANLELAQREAEIEQAKADIASEQVRFAADSESLPREQELLRLAEKEVTRLRGLVKKNVASQSTLDNARESVERQAVNVAKMQQNINDHESRLMSLHARLLKAQAQRDKAALELARTEIRAPFDGRIANVFVSPGGRVRVGDRLLEIFDRNAMVIKVLLPDRYIRDINAANSAGQPLRVEAQIDGQRIEADFLKMSAQVAENSGGIEAVFSIANPAVQVQQGRITSVGLILPPQDNLIAVPPEAIYGAESLYRVDAENRLQRVAIERIGEMVDAGGQPFVLVDSDELQEGEQIITTQLPAAIEGLLVRAAQ